MAFSTYRDVSGSHDDRLPVTFRDLSRLDRPRACFANTAEYHRSESLHRKAGSQGCKVARTGGQRSTGAAMKQVNQIGVDVDAQELMCATERARQRLPVATFANTAAGHRKFVRWVAKGGH